MLSCGTELMSSTSAEHSKNQVAEEDEVTRETGRARKQAGLNTGSDLFLIDFGQA
ncbi:MAG: hypothetical protein PsegKO_25910 [Pseudohongiellaceae bacterium]